MDYMTIKDCPVTRTTSVVTYPYIDNQSNDWYNRYGGYHTGIDIVCGSVHSACQGVVIMVGTDPDTHKIEITIQYDAFQGFRYCHLKSSYVNPGDIVENGQLIGEADSFVHFEYIDVNSTNALWVVHIGEMTYYKHDPEPYATGESVLPNEDLVNVVIVDANAEFAEVVFTDSMNDEFTNNRIDNVPNSV